MVAGETSKPDNREAKARAEPLQGQEALPRVPQAWAQSPCLLTCPSETTAKIPGARACMEVLQISLGAQSPSWRALGTL